MPSILENMNLSGRRVLVTGGGRGIGREIVQAFTELKATVFVIEVELDLLQALAADYPNGEVTGIHLDLREDLTKIQQVIQPLLPIHHLVNNAAIVDRRSVLDMDSAFIDRIFDVNLKGALKVSQVVARGMIQHQVTDGTIVNISSIVDTSAQEGYAAYSCSKAALAMLSKIMALEFGPFGIRVNYVRPTLVNTAMLNSLPESVQAEISKPVFDRAIFKRAVEPDEVSNAVVYLSSRLSAMVTGTAVTVDGGHGVN